MAGGAGTPVHSPWPIRHGNVFGTNSSGRPGADRGRVRWDYAWPDYGEDWSFSHLTVGTQGDIYAITNEHFRVLSARGRQRYEKPMSVAGVTALPRGEYLTYSGSYQEGRVTWWRSDGGARRTYHAPHSGFPSTPYLLPDGKILTVCLDGAQVEPADSSGTLFVSFARFYSSFKVKADPVMDRDGAFLLLSCWDGAIVRMSPKGQFLRRYDQTPEFYAGRHGDGSEPSLSLASDGMLYLVGLEQRNRPPHGIGAQLRAVRNLSQVRWTWDGPTYCGLDSPAVRSDGTVVYYPDPTGRLSALGARDGSVLWKFALPGAGNSQLLPPCLDVRGRIYTVDRRRPALLCLSPEGRLLWRVPLRGGNPDRPIIGPNRSVLDATDRYLYCIE